MTSPEDSPITIKTVATVLGIVILVGGYVVGFY